VDSLEGLQVKIRPAGAAAKKIFWDASHFFGTQALEEGSRLLQSAAGQCCVKTNSGTEMQACVCSCIEMAVFAGPAFVEVLQHWHEFSAALT